MARANTFSVQVTCRPDYQPSIVGVISSHGTRSVGDRHSLKLVWIMFSTTWGKLDCISGMVMLWASSKPWFGFGVWLVS